MLEIVHRISLFFSIPKKTSFSLHFGQEQNILADSFEKRAYQFVLKANSVLG